MLRAARVARGPHPATPANATPAPLRLPSRAARAPAAPSSHVPLSVASPGRIRGAAQLALPCTFSEHSERGRKPLDLEFSVDAARHNNGAKRAHLVGASSAPLALRPRALLGDEISRSANQLPRRGFSSSDSVASAKTSTGERTFNALSVTYNRESHA